jgi:hypothetical protein
VTVREAPNGPETYAESVVGWDEGALLFLLFLPLFCIPSAATWGVQMCVACLLLSRRIVYRPPTRPVVRCMVCKYDLSGLTLPCRCPECGTANPSIVPQVERRVQWMARPLFAVIVCLALAPIPLVVPLAWMCLYRWTGGFPISFGFALTGPPADSYDTPSAFYLICSGSTAAAFVLGMVCPRLALHTARKASVLSLIALSVVMLAVPLLAWQAGLIHWRQGKMASIEALLPLFGLCSAMLGTKLAGRPRPNLPE